MSYQLSLIQSLENSHTWCDTVLIAIAIIIPLLISQVPSSMKKVVPICVAISILLDLCLWGSGWKITGDSLHVKAFFSSADVKISTMEIGFIQPNSRWWHRSRIHGGDFPELFVGEYYLRNGKKALVFNQYKQKELLLISAQNNHYLIGHPGVIVLYNDLVRLGAKEGNF